MAEVVRQGIVEASRVARAVPLVGWVAGGGRGSKGRRGGGFRQGIVRQDNGGLGGRAWPRVQGLSRRWGSSRAQGALLTAIEALKLFL